MSSNNQLSFKVYHIENKKTKDIRKFTVDADVLGSFEYIIGKIRQVFPDLLRQNLDLLWKDEEDDYLTISSDDELDQAIQEIPVGSSNLKLYVKEKQELSKSNQETEHPGVTCDSCNSKVRGIRYKCTQCHDFDLCSTCEREGTHPVNHEMISIKTPRQYSSGFVIHHPQFSRGHFSGRCHERRPFHCQFMRSQPESCGKKPEQDKAQGPTVGQNGEQYKQCVERLAAAFGLAPDVAVSSVKSFFDDLSQQNTKQEEGNKENVKNEKDKETTQEKQDGNNEQEEAEFFENIAGSLGIDPTFVAHVTANLFPELKKEEEKETEETGAKNEGYPTTETPTENVKCEEGSKTKDPIQSTSTEEKRQSNPPSIEELANHFGQQIGLNSQTEQNSTQDLGNLLQTMFQQFLVPNLQQEKSKLKDETQKSPDNFENKNNELSEEEKYQQRLDKALRQMESMGFDNDGGWLSQLLVSKDLSIGRVLDALNPQN